MGSFVGSFVGYFVDSLVGCFVDSLVGCLVDVIADVTYLKYVGNENMLRMIVSL